MKYYHFQLTSLETNLFIGAIDIVANDKTRATIILNEKLTKLSISNIKIGSIELNTKETIESAIFIPLNQ
jgi:hypothetical protein